MVSYSIIAPLLLDEGLDVAYFEVRRHIHNDAPLTFLKLIREKLANLQRNMRTRHNKAHKNWTTFSNINSNYLKNQFEIDEKFLLLSSNILQPFTIRLHKVCNFYYDGLPETYSSLQALISSSFVPTDETVINGIKIKTSPTEKNTYVYFDFKLEGLGLKARNLITMGEIILGYSGKYITDADEINKIDEENKSCYFVGLGEGVVDSRMTGNESRFLNHSCADSNAVLSVNRDETAVNVIAKRSIYPHTIITINYCEGEEETPICDRFRYIAQCRCSSLHHLVGSSAKRSALSNANMNRKRGKFSTSSTVTNKDPSTGMFTK